MFDLNDDVMIAVKTNYNHSGTSEYSDLLNNDNDDSVSYDAHNESKDASDVSLITKQLFPVDNDNDNDDEVNESVSGVMTSSTELMTSSPTMRADWLNLKVPEYEPVPVKPRKSRRGPPSKSSQYRGVTFYRRTGRWESHIWDCGKQLYLGGFDTSHDAARAYDRAAIKFRGTDADINFELSDYEEDMALVKNLSKEDFIHVLRRQSNGFLRGSSKYRGVTLHKHGRWEALMGQRPGKKAYDKAAIKCNGREAITNFEPNTYGAYKNLEGMDAASGRNLDLSLWVSPTKDGPKRNHVQSVDIGFTARDFPSRKKTKVAGFTPTMGGHSYHDPTAAQHLPAWTGMYSGHNPSYEEMTARMGSGSVVHSQGVSNAAWQMQMVIGHHAAGPIPGTSNAASSGFASSFTKYMDPLFLSNIIMQNKTSSTHDTFNSMPTGTSSQY